MKKVKILLGSFMAALVLMGCSKEVEDKGPEPAPNPFCKIIFEFTHNVDGADIILDTAQYENASGNIYGVENLEYLVGKIRLKSWNNPDHVFIDEYHLVNLKDPSTLTFSPKDSIRIDDYNDLTLFLGFEEQINVTGNFPELSNLGWNWLAKHGGGYHIMKMNGTYFSNASSTTSQLYDMAIGGYIRKETPNDTLYVPNGTGTNPTCDLYASLPSQGFAIPTGTKVVKVEIRMDVNKLFKDNLSNANYNLDVHQTNIPEDALGSSTLSHNIEYAYNLGSVTLDEAVQAP